MPSKKVPNIPLRTVLDGTEEFHLVAGVVRDGGGNVTNGGDSRHGTVAAVVTFGGSLNLSNLASAATARTNLGLGSAATFAASAFLQTSNNFSDVPNIAAARTNLSVYSKAEVDAAAFDSDRYAGTFVKWQAAKLRGAAAPARLLMIGDSNVAGEGSGTGSHNLTGAFTTGMAAKLAAAAGFGAQSMLGDQNTKFEAVAYSTYDGRVTLGSGWAPDAGTSEVVGGNFFLAAGGSTGTFKLAPVGNVTKFRLYHPINAGLNTGVQVFIDGTLVDTFSQAGASAMGVRDYPVASGPHYIEVKPGAGAGSAYVQGIEVWDGSGNPLLLQGGFCSAKMADLATVANAWSSRNQLATMAVDYAVIYCTINDATAGTALDTYVSNLLNVITTLSATADGCLCVGFPAQFANDTNGYYDSMALLLKGIAKDYGWSFYDGRKIFGHSWFRANQLGYYFDTVHPNGAGHLAFANGLYSFLHGIGL